jgi:hypothetical protein
MKLSRVDGAALGSVCVATLYLGVLLAVALGGAHDGSGATSEGQGQARALSTPAAITAWHPYTVVDSHAVTWCVSDRDGHTFPPVTQP